MDPLNYEARPGFYVTLRRDVTTRLSPVARVVRKKWRMHPRSRGRYDARREEELRVSRREATNPRVMSREEQRPERFVVVAGVGLVA